MNWILGRTQPCPKPSPKSVKSGSHRPVNRWAFLWRPVTGHNGTGAEWSYAKFIVYSERIFGWRWYSDVKIWGPETNRFEGFHEYHEGTCPDHPHWCWSSWTIHLTAPPLMDTPFCFPTSADPLAMKRLVMIIRECDIRSHCQTKSINKCQICDLVFDSTVLSITLKSKKVSESHRNQVYCGESNAINHPKCRFIGYIPLNIDMGWYDDVEWPPVMVG